MTTSQQSSTSSAMQAMDHAAALQTTQPRAALPFYQGLRDSSDFPCQDYASEQCGIILAQLGRESEAQHVFEELIGKLRDHPEQAFAWARNVIHLAELRISANDPRDESLEEVQQWLDQAEKIFQINGTFGELGRVSQLKASISATEQEFSKANEQAERGRRLEETYELATVRQPHRSTIATQAMNGLQN